MIRRSDRFARAVFLLWVALLSFTLPEVFAGTGKNWLTRPDVYILGIPLYALHFLVLANIAMKTHRTGWRALYVLGLLFGLYETWITKVVWSGYAGDGQFAVGSFGDWFGVHETVALIFFYHAVTSFLLPLAVLTRLFPAWGAVFPRPDWIFAQTRWGFVRRLALLMIWAAMSALNIASPSAYLVTWAPMLVLLWAGYRWLGKHGATQPGSTISAPRLGVKGMAVAVVGLGLIYLIPYENLRPESLPPASAQTLTLLLYPLLGILLWRSGPSAPPPSPAHMDSAARLPWGWLLAIFTTGFAFTLLSALSPQALSALRIVAFLTILPLGAALFLWLVILPLLKRHQG